MATTLVAVVTTELVATPVPIMERVLTGHTDGVWAVATTELDGRPVAVSGSGDDTLRIWDLTARTSS